MNEVSFHPLKMTHQQVGPGEGKGGKHPPYLLFTPGAIPHPYKTRSLMSWTYVLECPQSKLTDWDGFQFPGFADVPSPTVLGINIQVLCHGVYHYPSHKHPLFSKGKAEAHGHKIEEVQCHQRHYLEMLRAPLQ